MAELDLLSRTRGIIMSRASPVSWFVVAQATRRLSGKGRKKREGGRKRGSGRDRFLAQVVGRMTEDLSGKTISRTNDSSAFGSTATIRKQKRNNHGHQQQKQQPELEEPPQQQQHQQHQQNPGGFLVYKPICNNKPRWPFRLRRFAVQMIVDGEINCTAATLKWLAMLPGVEPPRG